MKKIVKKLAISLLCLFMITENSDIYAMNYSNGDFFGDHNELQKCVDYINISELSVSGNDQAVSLNNNLEITNFTYLPLLKTNIQNVCSNYQPFYWPTPNVQKWKTYDGHTGIDIQCGNGTSVYAAKAGTVVKVWNGCPHVSAYCSCNDKFGNGVVIAHSDGTMTEYAHFSLNTVAVSNGQSVQAGTYLGKSGSSGFSGGYHLHFGIRAGANTYNGFWKATVLNASPQAGVVKYYYTLDQTIPTCIVTYETYGTGGTRGNVSDTNATLYTVVYTNARANISIGLRIGTENGNWNLKTHEEALSNSGYNQLNRQGNFEAWFDCNSELGISFTSGTTYWYQYYVKIDGKEYADEARTFKTKGTAPDKQKPTVSNLKITEVSKDGYRVTVNVSDNVGVKVVKFPTWISGSSNVKWLEGTVKGTTATCYIKASDFTNNSADFVTDVYAYDAADNVSEPIRGTVFIDRTESSPSGSEENDTDKTIRVEGVHDVTYNGKDQKFDLSVYEGNHLLISGLDYNVIYKKNRNVGTGSVIVNVKGIKESYTENFIISPLDISGENFRVSNTSKGYKAGKSYKLTAKLFRNGVELVKDKDYTYLEDYQNETGIYNIVISGKGNYTGTRIATYEITDKPLISNAKVSGFKDFFNYTGFAKEQTFMVLKYKGKTLSEGKDYNVRYENNTSVGVAYVYIMGVGEFGGEFRKSFRIIGKDMSRVKATVKSTTYDGMAKKPNIVLKYGNTRLAEGRDYDVRYEKNINAGTGKAIVTFKGAYTGTKKYSFTINRAKIKKDDVNCDGSVYLTMENGKKVANAKVSVYFNGKKLIAGRDYVVKYSGGTKVGKTRTVTISGRGNFRGSVTKTFKVIG